MPSDHRKSMLRKFELECIQHASFRHPNIVQVIGIHSTPGSSIPMLILEYMPMSLNKCLDSTSIPLSLKYRMLLDVCLGLRFLHGQDPPFIHRDLTANNVLLSEGIRAKIADFGVGRVIDAIAKKNMTMTIAPGTQAYMPPEAKVAKPKYNVKLDVFSFGVLVIHIFLQVWPLPLCGETTHDPNDPDKLIPVSQVEMRVEYFDTMGGDNPLSHLSKKCLSNNPAKRPDIAEIQVLLKELVTKEPYPFCNSLEALQEVNSSKAMIEALKSNDVSCGAQIQAVVQDTKAKLSMSQADLHTLSKQLQTIAHRLQPVVPQSLPNTEVPFVVTHPSQPPFDLKLTNYNSTVNCEVVVRPPLNISFGAMYVKTVISGDINPRDMAVNDDGVVFIVNYDGRKGIHICNPDGSKRAIVDSATFIERPTPSHKCWYPRGIALDHQGNIFLCDTDSHRVLKFDSTGALLAVAGTADQPGSKFGTFWQPRGIIITNDNEVYICDRYNHRIQIFASDLSFLDTFGKEGSGPSEFDQPFDIAFDSAGRIYVVDCGNRCVKIFSHELKPVGRIGGTTQSKVEDFRKPVAICIDRNDNIFVADYDKHCVLVFDVEGRFKMHFGNYGTKEGLFNHPVGLTTDKYGQVYVSDERNRRVVVFK